MKLSDRDHLCVLALLEDPPQPNAKLRAAIAALPISAALNAPGKESRALYARPASGVTAGLL